MLSANSRLGLRRLGRRLIWPAPWLYAPCGVFRRGCNVFARGHQLYIDGFPRSGNTFALKAFLLANPGVSVRCHQHIPTFTVQSVKRDEPGMVLLRKPIDAAISWSIYEGQSLGHSLSYYSDFYSVLLKHCKCLFLVTFESVISDFGRVIRDFNERWGTSFAPFEHTPPNVARCIAQIDEDYADGAGGVLELRVARPSNCRQPLKEKLMSKIRVSPALERELMRATEIYQKLLPRDFTSKIKPAQAKSTQGIRFRPAG